MKLKIFVFIPYISNHHIFQKSKRTGFLETDSPVWSNRCSLAWQIQLRLTVLPQKKEISSMRYMASEAQFKCLVGLIINCTFYYCDKLYIRIVFSCSREGRYICMKKEVSSRKRSEQ